MSAGRAPQPHKHAVERFGESIDLDHYLEVLQHKPGALPGSTALAAARTAGTFTAAHEAFGQESRKVNGDSRGTRELIDMLLLHSSMRAVDVTAGIRAALTVGAVTADVVAVEARLHASGTVRAGLVRPVAPLTKPSTTASGSSA